MSILPLKGVRVVDFGVYWAIPMLGHIMADHGAEVIFVETTTRMDQARRQNFELPDQRPIVRSQFHHRNKLGVTLNLKQPEAPGLVKDLVRTSDVVIENFTVGTLGKFGLDYPALRRVKPDLIMLSVTAAGQNGPLAGLVSFGPAMNALAGTDSMVGYEDGSLMVNMIDADPTMGTAIVLPMLAALYRRKRTGKGQYIDTCFLETMGAMLGEAYMEYGLTGRLPGPKGNTHPRYAPHGVYPCKGVQRWVSIAVTNEDEWRAFRRILGDPAWTREARFATMPERNRNHQALDELIGHWTLEREAYEVMHAMQAAGVAASVVMNGEDLHKDPHDRFRRELTIIDNPSIGIATGDDVAYGIPWRLGATPGTIRKPSPTPGEDNDPVFGELLGISRPEIERLVETGVMV